MGHDISVYKAGDASETEISYLRISAWDRFKCNLFYAALNATAFDAGVSGVGKTVDFTLDNIKLAKSKLGYLKKEDSEVYRNKIADVSSVEMLSQISRMLSGKDLDVTSGASISVSESESIEDIERFFDEIITSGEETLCIYFG
jgi:hypothetical protein